ncbi:transposase [Pseudarthrobacter sp. NPDC092184]|uniref:transposase n=1 Tax=unclassified Pseudarthrobacter TaxID=2647000 RepID=UPI0038308B44
MRDIPVAGPVEVVRAKRRFFCDEYLCPRRTFTEETAQVPRRARTTRWLRYALVAAVIGSGRAAAEAASSFGVSWWLVQRALDSAALTLPDVDALAPRMLGLDEHRYRSVRFVRDPATKAWTRYEPWMTTLVDLDTGQVLGIVDGRDSEGVGNWLFARPIQWRLGVQVVALDPSAAFRKALRMWLPRTAVSVDAFHLASYASTGSPKSGTASRSGFMAGVVAPSARSGPTGDCCCLAETHSRTGHGISSAPCSLPMTPPGSCRPHGLLSVKEQLRALLTTGALADAAAVKDRLQALVVRPRSPKRTGSGGRCAAG